MLRACLVVRVVQPLSCTLRLSPVVACYREFSRAVYGANQIALQLRIMTRTTAVCVFVLRYSAATAFATCKALGLVERGTTMWEFQSRGSLRDEGFFC